MFAGCKYFGIMLGDKRCCDESGKIISDNVQKVRKLNQHLIIEFGGDTTFIEMMQTTLLEHPELNSLTLEDCIQIIQNKFNMLLPSIRSHIKNKLTFNTGIGIASNSKNLIQFAYLHLLNDTLEITRFSFPGDYDNQFCFVATGLGELGKKYNATFSKHPVYSLSHIRSVFIETLEEESNNDYTINDSYTCEYLVREDIYDERKDRKRDKH